MRRSLLLFLAWSLAGASIAAAQCSRYAGVPIDMQVQLVLDGNQPIPDSAPPGSNAGSDNAHQASGTSGQSIHQFTPSDQIRVQLLDGYGGNLKEGMPAANGKLVFRVCSKATYRLRVTGQDIQEATAENLDPGHGDRIVNLALHWKQQNNVTNETGTISASRLKVPRRAQSWMAKGNSALAKNDLIEAKLDFQKAIEAYPDFDQAYNNLGVVLMNSGDAAGGKAAFQKAIEINAHFGRGLSNLARIAFDEKDFKQALEFARRSLSVEPLNPRTLLVAAQAAYFSGAYSDTVSFARALHSLPHQEMGLAHYLAAKSLEKQALLSEAIAEYQIFLQEDPGDPNVPLAQMAILELKASAGTKLN